MAKTEQSANEDVVRRREGVMPDSIMKLIAQAPWREAVTYRETWPHEYVLTEKDNQRELLEATIARFKAGEGVSGRFFRMENTYLFLGNYKYWFMVPIDQLDPDAEGDYVLNRAPLYRDRRDFVIQPGDTGKPEDYPAGPAVAREETGEHSGQ